VHDSEQPAVDLVVVGAGIAGSAFAAVMAEAGFEVVLLERDTAYRDKVRGEIFHPWGVAELIRMGLHRALLDAGGGYATHFVEYKEGLAAEEAEAEQFTLTGLIPGVPGSLNVGHPEACAALSRAAVQAGASLMRGVSDVQVTFGPHPSVEYQTDGVTHRKRCRLIVGADGRSSSVRRQADLQLHELKTNIMATGLLVEGLSAWPDSRVAVGTEGDVHFFVIPRPGGLARLYLLWEATTPSRFVGPQRHADFLAAFRLDCLPFKGDELASSIPAGPCASYPMTDSWADAPHADGMVLIGDAAGWNNPVIGQGISVAVRDARIVSDILRASPQWSDSALAPYAQERAERMRWLRLSARLSTELDCRFGEKGTSRRVRWADARRTNPSLQHLILCRFVGTEAVPWDDLERSSMGALLHERFEERCDSNHGCAYDVRPTSRMAV
jgi:2-polyprenyl-6-methoxyphenol hydroxylase-like FAD-dependent oxidoreductase